MAFIQTFNQKFIEFVKDLKHLKFEGTQKYLNLDIIESALDVKKELVIRNFQVYILKDVTVANILNKNTDYFIHNSFIQDSSFKEVSPAIKDVFASVQNIIVNMKETEDGRKNIDNIFNWMILLSYFAYSDIGINAQEKFNELRKNTSGILNVSQSVS